MPKSSRPRKPYRPKPVLKPLGIKNTLKLEMPGYVGLAALGKDWLDISHLRDIGAHASLVEKVAEASGEADIAALACAVIAICLKCEDRFERTGRPGTTGDEMREIRHALAVTLPWLSAQPNSMIHRKSLELVRAYDRAVAEVANAA